MDNYTITFLIVAAIIGLIPAMIANGKGRSFWGWWFFGTMVFIVALPAALIIQPDQRVLERRQLSSGTGRKCPYCAEVIKSEATVCRYCGKEIPLDATIESVTIELETLSASGSAPAPMCSVHHVPLLLRTAVKGEHLGKQFYVCPNYKECQQLFPAEEVPPTRKADLQAEEMMKFRQGFILLGWYEEVGRNTTQALASAPLPLQVATEPVVCVAYADIGGTHINRIWFDGREFTPKHKAMIATKLRIIIDSNSPLVYYCLYKELLKVSETMTQQGEVKYTLETKSGHTIELEIHLEDMGTNRREDISRFLDLFFHRIAS